MRTVTYNDIIQILEKLDESIKTPFTLFVKGYKYREIADQLSLPIGTIKSRIFLGRQVLMQQLKDFA